MEQTMTKGPVLKALIRFMIPVFLANLLQALYGTVDLLMVGKFAATADVSAVSTGSMTMQTLSAIIIGMSMGATIRIGHLIGAGQKEKTAKTVSTALILYLAIGLALSLVVFILAGQIAVWMNAPADAYLQTVGYIQICAAGILSIVLFNAFGSIFRGFGNSRVPLLLMAVAALCNVAGDYILVGLLGWGAYGAAIATVFAQTISWLTAAWLVFIRKKLGIPISLKQFRIFPAESAFILKYGTPIAIQEFLTGISFMVILSILNGFGLNASAGVGIAEKICALMFLVPGAAMAAVSTFSAQNIGAGKMDRALQGMKISMLMTTAAGILMFLASFFAGDIMASFFSTDREVILAAEDYLKSYGIDCMLAGINFCMMGYLNGLGKTGFVALQGILSTFLIRIPVSYLMSLNPDTTLFQIGLATPLASVFAIVITLIYLRYLKTAKTAALS